MDSLNIHSIAFMYFFYFILLVTYKRIIINIIFYISYYLNKSLSLL